MGRPHEIHSSVLLHCGSCPDFVCAIEHKAGSWCSSNRSGGRYLDCHKYYHHGEHSLHEFSIFMGDKATQNISSYWCRIHHFIFASWLVRAWFNWELCEFSFSNTALSNCIDRLGHILGASDEVLSLFPSCLACWSSINLFLTQACSWLLLNKLCLGYVILTAIRSQKAAGSEESLNRGIIIKLGSWVFSIVHIFACVWFYVGNQYAVRVFMCLMSSCEAVGFEFDVSLVSPGILTRHSAGML